MPVQVIHSLEEADVSAPAHVTIGAFDGVHLGHRRLIGGMTEAAHAAGRTAVVITFDPHPGAVLGRRPVAALSTIEERTALLDQIGVDVLVVLRFTPAIAGMPASRFTMGLCRHLQMAELWAGPDFALGHRREGDVAYLRAAGERLGFTVRIVEPAQWRGQVVSSTRIRAALTAGDIEEANGCLGRPYRLSGLVVHGRGLGRTLGFPTANIEPPAGRLIPANGVYACVAHTERGKQFLAVTNIGVRPTFVADRLTVEAHLLDFNGDLYGQQLGVDFIAWLRDEETFPSLNALVSQLGVDVSRARQVLSAVVADLRPSE
jgi:riboflavin kinase/FMN adenylyltransferase